MSTSRRSHPIFIFTLIALSGGVFSGFLSFYVQSAQAQAQAIPLEVVVTIKHVAAIANLEGPLCGEEDFFARVWINGIDKGSSDTMDGQSEIYPDWEFKETVNYSEGSAPVRIEIWEDDWGVCGFDDQADVSPLPDDKDVEIVVDLSPCLVSGDVFGECDLVFSRSGAGDEATLIEFTVKVNEPAYGPNLRVMCTIDSLIPKLDDTVTITATATDANGDNRISDSIEIWFDATPESNDVFAPIDSRVGGVSKDETIGPLIGDFAYGCRAVDDGLVAWTGWRTVTVGEPAEDATVVPVQITGPRSSRIDVVFIADKDQYGSALDTQFLDGSLRIMNSYFDMDIFRKHQNQFNFWIALQTGSADDGSDGECEHSAPRIAWMDAGVVVHGQPTIAFKNCADPDKHLLSATTAKPLTILHESGHVPFGLSDEYDDGGFWQSRTLPNVYHTINDYYDPNGRLLYIGCATDAPTVGRTAEDCRPIKEEVDWWFNRVWYTSDPEEDDLMAEGDVPHALDIRRMEWIFNNCASARQC